MSVVLTNNNTVILKLCIHTCTAPAVGKGYLKNKVFFKKQMIDESQLLIILTKAEGAWGLSQGWMNLLS